MRNLYNNIADKTLSILGRSMARKALAGCDSMVYLAAWKAAGESMLDPYKYSRNNLMNTLSFLEAAHEVGVRNVVFSSSAGRFGGPVRRPPRPPPQHSPPEGPPPGRGGSLK